MHVKLAIEGSNLNLNLLEIANAATPIVTFWGSRSIQVEGYEGVDLIDALAEAIIKLAHSNNFEFTTEEREIGDQIARRITRIYAEIDEVVAESNCFTRLCCAIQDFFIKCSISFPPRQTSLIRHLWGTPMDPGYYRVFDHYTPEQFFLKYGRMPDNGELFYVFGNYNGLPRTRLAIDVVFTPQNN